MFLDIDCLNNTTTYSFIIVVVANWQSLVFEGVNTIASRVGINIRETWADAMVHWAWGTHGVLGNIFVKPKAG